MELILWRHADAEPGARDEERKLTAKGKKQAKRMAMWLNKRLPEDAKVLASPARRAIQTAEALTERFEVDPRLGTRSSPADILSAAGWPNGKGAVVVVGHQPTLGRTASFALTGTELDWLFKKGAVWWLVSRDEEEGAAAIRAVVAPDFA